ncbi:MAG: hypothetical protein VKK59_07655 [Vampirovibrionales bacterium]|nr:hypothetical protein [Vampirovibrionales bacterium]
MMPSRRRALAAQFEATVVHRVELAEAQTLLKIQSSSLPELEFPSGAFAMVSLKSSVMVSRGVGADVFQLARAYTPFACMADGTCWLYVKAVGRISKALANAPVGSTLALMGPLGLGWPSFCELTSWQVLADSANLAPVLSLATQASQVPLSKIHVLGHIPTDPISGRQWPSVFQPEMAMRRLSEAVLDTTDFWTRFFEDTPSPSPIAMCLSEPWLQKALLAAQGCAQLHRIWVYLKPTMACGTGSCYGCVIDAAEGLPIRVCWEGPLIKASQLLLRESVV